MPSLTAEHFETIDQLITEMQQFPPDYFTDENRLSWSKYFGIAPQDLSEYTSQTAKILQTATRLAKKAQGLDDTTEALNLGTSRCLNPIPSFESFHFLWLQTLLIMMPQTDGTLLDQSFSPYFKMACCVQNTQEILADLALTVEYYNQPTDLCERHNATLILMENLKLAVESSNVLESRNIYDQIYRLNQNAMTHSDILKTLKTASPGMQEKFIITADAISPVQTENGEEIKSLETQDNFEQNLRQKLAKLAEDFSQKDLSFFKDLDIKMDATQEQAFISQLKQFLLNLSEGSKNLSVKHLTGSAV